MSETRFDFANALRGPAALSVLISHFLHNVWTMRPLIEAFANVSLPPEKTLATPRYVIALSNIPPFDWGSYGVAIFFLVSGFVIPLSLKKYSPAAFLIGRVFRIWPVYLCGFTISILSIYLGGFYFGKPFHYTAKQILIHTIPGIRDLLWSANIDGIIWTLEIEVKFYVLCALLTPLIRRPNPLIFIAPVAIGLGCLGATGYLESGDQSHRLWQLVYVLALSGQFIVFMFLGTVVR